MPPQLAMSYLVLDFNNHIPPHLFAKNPVDVNLYSSDVDTDLDFGTYLDSDIDIIIFV